MAGSTASWHALIGAVCLAALPRRAAPHNWMHNPPGRAGGRAATSIPTRPSVRAPSMQVGAGQDFALQWMSGHPGEPYYFVMLHADDEAKLAEHSTEMLEAYLAAADDAARAPYADEGVYARYHVSCSANYPASTNDCDGCKNCGQRDGSPNGGPDEHDGYAGVLAEDDALFYAVPDEWSSEDDGEQGLAHFTYTAESRAADDRAAYASADYPWIEAVHKMTPAVKFAQERDTARFTIPGRAGPGEYLIHMFWKHGAYHDVIDVDVLAADATDIYGTASDDAQWVKVDHCQYLSSIYDVGSGFVFKNNKGATCVPVTAAGGYDASECLDLCEAAGEDACAAVNVVPWTHPPLVAAHAAATELAVNVPYARETAKGKKSDCDPDNYVAKHGTPAADDMVCYGLVANDDDEDEVDTPWSVVDDDTEDPVFYSTCFRLQTGRTFANGAAADDGGGGGGAAASSSLAPAWRFGEHCVACAASEANANAALTVAPWWEVSSDCERCA